MIRRVGWEEEGSPPGGGGPPTDGVRSVKANEGGPTGGRPFPTRARRPGGPAAGGGNQGPPSLLPAALPLGGEGPRLRGRIHPLTPRGRGLGERTLLHRTADGQHEGDQASAAELAHIREA